LKDRAEGILVERPGWFVLTLEDRFRTRPV